MEALSYYNYDFGTSLIMETNHNNILSFFFNGDKLIRKSTDPRPLVKQDQHNKKQAAQEALIASMSEYLGINPDANLLELAYALKNNYTVPPVCQVCSTPVKFNRNGWSAHCSVSCSLKNEQVKLAKREASLQKWGVIHQFSRADSIAKKEAYFASQNITRDKRAAQRERKIQQEQLRAARIRAREAFLEERKAAKSAKYTAAGFVNLVYGKKDRLKWLHVLHAGAFLQTHGHRSVLCVMLQQENLPSGDLCNNFLNMCEICESQMEIRNLNWTQLGQIKI